MSLQSPTFLSRGAATVALTALCLFAAPAAGQSPKLDVHFVPTPQAVVDRMLEMAQVSSEDYVVDLGSGDGRIPVTAALKYGARAYGVDLDPQRIKEANENAKRNNVTDKVKFEQKDLFETQIKDATVVTMYLLSSINLRLKPRLLEELRPGTRVVSHAFNMGSWEPDDSDTVQNSNIYFWIIPAKVDGRWNVQDDNEKFTVTLKQEFQKISGTADINGRAVPLKEARLRGDLISFSVDTGKGQPRVFTGRVDGDTIRAAEAPGGAPAGHAKKWSASRAS